MNILSQDEKALFNYDNIVELYITNTLMKDKYTIIANSTDRCFSWGDDCILASFDKEENCKKVFNLLLDKIDKNLKLIRMKDLCEECENDYDKLSEYIKQDKELEELIFNIISFKNKLAKKYAATNLKDYKTYELSRELGKREEIKSIFVEPYGKSTITVENENPADNVVLNIEGCATIMIDRT